MKMLSDLLIGHNWPINGHFCQINQKNQLVDPNENRNSMTIIVGVVGLLTFRV